MLPRTEINQKLQSTDFDLIVIGGGITGCGVARDAARRGLRVALLEAKDFAYGTSSRSSKLIHGGLRYLDQKQLGLVFEAVNERRTLQRVAPHLVNAQGFLFPVYRHSPLGLCYLKLGLWVYEALVFFRVPKLHTSYNAKKTLALEPYLASDGLSGSPLYWDCTTDDARLTLETALDAHQVGAVLGTYRKVVGFVRAENGNLEGVEIQDKHTGEKFVVRGRCVVNATGPWSDRTRALFGMQGQILRPTKGIHVVVDSKRLPLRYAVVLHHPDDGRILFAVPWGDRTYVGTTDTDYQGDPADVAATRDDVEYLLRSCERFFPDAQLGEEDIIATWAGLRPLVAADSQNASDVSREHRIVVEPEGLVTIAGGKLTTYRRMSAEVVDACGDILKARGVSGFSKDSGTQHSPLPGAVGWSKKDDHQSMAQKALTASKGAIELDTAQYLVDQYGARGVDFAEWVTADSEASQRLIPGRPEVLGVVDWAVREEFAASLSDVMIRRTQLFFKEKNQGLDVAERVAKRMAALLGWSPERVMSELDEYRDEVALSRKWRTN